MNLTLRVWRQKNAQEAGKLVSYVASDVSPDMSFLEMLDVVNEHLIQKGEEPIAFDSDCREGICGMCSLVINGVPMGRKSRKGRRPASSICASSRTAMSSRSSPGVPGLSLLSKDLVCNRSAFDRIIQAGGFVSINTGGAPDANAIPSLNGMRTGPWMRRPVSAAAPASPPARMLPRCSSWRPKSRICHSCLRGRSRRKTASARWSPEWTRRVSAAAPTSRNVRRSVQKKSRLISSPR